MHQPFENHHIILPEQACAATRSGSPATLGNADVLADLFPELAPIRVGHAKTHKTLHQVDHYMLEEIGHIGKRLQQYARELGCHKADIRLSRNTSGLTVYSNAREHARLTQRVYTDSWLIDAFAWLEPNLVALANSIELLEFAEHYQRCSSDALTYYRHLDQDGCDMAFSIRLNADTAKGVLESPRNVFIT